MARMYLNSLFVVIQVRGEVEGHRMRGVGKGRRDVVKKIPKKVPLLFSSSLSCKWYK
jgi:hypothetical protein